MTAVKWLGEHGWGRPLQQVELEAHFGGQIGVGLDAGASAVVGQLSAAERMRRIAELEAKRKGGGESLAPKKKSTAKKKARRSEASDEPRDESIRAAP